MARTTKSASTAPTKRSTRSRKPSTTTRKPAQAASAAQGFTEEEKAAARERVREIRAAARGGADGERDVLEKIKGMSGNDRAIAERLHDIVKRTAPELEPRTWYGMPAYGRQGNVLFYYRPAAKFKTRYAIMGFSDKAKLDDGAMWPTEFAIAKLGAAEEREIKGLLKKALG